MTFSAIIILYLKKLTNHVSEEMFAIEWFCSLIEGS